MLIATFNDTTGWRGKTITFEDEHFILEGHGRISPKNIMKYDEKGQLTWAGEGMRGWVGSRARGSRMVILAATFDPSTGWAGKTITFEDEHFVLEGHGDVSPRNIMKYDKKGQLVWASAEMRPWVISLAQTPTQPGPETRPRSEISGPLGLVGLLLVIGGLLAVVYFIAGFDTSVPVGDYGFDRVNNIGLMRDQQNGTLAGIVAAVIGGVLLVIAYSRGELDDWLKRAPAAGDRKCPYCAETIKADAVVCRFCNRDTPPGGNPSATVQT